jgi:hypothetical protein
MTILRRLQLPVTPYSDSQITEQEFKLDEPSGVENQPTPVTIDGAPATMFFGNNSIKGDTREIWFIHGGFLYEVTRAAGPQKSRR